MRPVAAITGASSGIGAAVAVELAGRGYDLAICGRNVERITGVSERCEALGAKVSLWIFDVTDNKAVIRFMQDTVMDFGRIDVMVNSAGQNIGGPSYLMLYRDFMGLMALNVGGVFSCCRAVVPAMIAKGSGHVFNLSSSLGYTPKAGRSAYCATKYAVRGFTECLRQEVAEHGVKVTCVLPTLTDTPMINPLRKSEAMAAEEVAKRIADAIGTDVAELMFE